MDAQAFLRLIVPAEGIKYLGISTQGGRPAHYAYDYFDPMAEAAAQFSRQRRDVYFALASYKPPVQATDRAGSLVFHPDGQPKMLKRTASLALRVRAFWADLDCGASKPYATQDEAVDDVARFVSESGAPHPLLVNSGGGVHAYWPIDQDIPAATWQAWAKHWRTVLHYYGVKSDPARDMDVASILRVPGTGNHKREAVRPVSILQDATASSGREFFSWLSAQAKLAKPVAPAAAKGSLGAIPEWLKADDADNADLTGHSGALKSSAAEASRHCAQLRLVASLRGDVDEPVWRAMLGVVKHSSEGDALAHEWSTGHPEYDEGLTQDKLDRWTAGPTTCLHFQNINPAECDGCPHMGKVTSPIQLGITFVEKQVISVAVAVETDTEAGVQVQTQEVTLPPGYIWDAGKSLLCKQVRSDDGVVDNVPFSRSLFYAVARIRGLDSTYQMRLRSHHARGVREFSIPTAEVAVCNESFLKALGAREVFTYANSEKVKGMLRNYLFDEVRRCEQAGHEVITFDQFGWHDEGRSFLLGTKLFRKDPGESTEVLSSDGLKTHKEIGAESNASSRLWAEAVQSVYGAPGAEPLQYAIAASFGSPLSDLFGDDYHGAAVCLSGVKSGQGKTTACWVGLSVWGKPSQMMYSNREGSTFNARIARHGRYKNLPVLHDELSMFSPDEAMALLYAMANGRGRARLDQSGENEREPRRWKMSGYVTTNRPLNDLVANAKGGLMATVVRNFEINLDDYVITTAEIEPMRIAREAIEANCGAAGEVFAQYIVSHRETVKQVIREMSDRIVARLPVLANDTRFRLYRMHLEATLTGALLANKLGLLKFDMKRLMAWALAHTEKLCVFANEVEEEQNATPVERMFSDLLSRTIITEGYRDSRSKEGPERPLQIPRDAPIARFVVGTPSMGTGAWAARKLIVTISAVREWASANRMTKTKLLQVAQEGGYYDGSKAGRYYLTRGTPLPGGQEFCYVFDLTNADTDRALATIQKGDDDAADD
jgi:hypothetical protein